PRHGHAARFRRARGWGHALARRRHPTRPRRVHTPYARCVAPVQLGTRDGGSRLRRSLTSRRHPADMGRTTVRALLPRWICGGRNTRLAGVALTQRDGVRAGAVPRAGVATQERSVKVAPPTKARTRDRCGKMKWSRAGSPGARQVANLTLPKTAWKLAAL